MKHFALKMQWRPGDPRIATKLALILAGWEGTPYVPGRQVAGRGPLAGVDCIRFVCGVLDALYGYTREPTFAHTLPPDGAMHNRAGAIKSMRKILSLYQPGENVTDGSLEPGDVIVAGVPGGGPGHALIVGERPNTLWHSTHKGVAWTGLSLGAQSEVHGVFRCTDRERWVS